MSNKQMVDIRGLDKAAVLAVLFNASAPAGMGFLQAGNGPSVMTVEYAKQLIDNGGSPDYGLSRNGALKFDYLFGRPLKVNLENDEFDPAMFDRDNGGIGTAQQWIEMHRNTGQVNFEQLSDHRKELLQERSARVSEIIKTPSHVEGSTVYLGGDEVAGPLIHHHDQEVARFLREW